MSNYPSGRTSFFGNKFIRRLTKSAAAQDLGADGCWLLSVIAMLEDTRRYSGPVTFWNGQLMHACGIKSEKRLSRIRKLAVDYGWLHYIAGTKSKPGQYWVAIPSELAAEFSPVKSQGNSLDSPVKSQGNVEANNGIPPSNRKGKGRTFIPTPINTPSPSTCNEEEGDSFLAIQVRLSEQGVNDSIRPVELARERGVSAAELSAVIDYAERNKFDPGALWSRVKNALPGQSPDAGWPGKQVNQSRVLQRQRDEQERIRYRIVKRGRAVGKSEEEIESELAAAGVA